MSECSNPRSQAAHKTAICTLFEGDYHFGLAALVNSLVRAGFEGTVWVGYRGALPPWLSQLKRLDTPSAEYMVAEQTRLVFLPIETKIHFTSYKPQFMLDLLANQACDVEYIWYFDPDICIRCNWSFFTTWQRYGVALCQELITNILPENSPLRQRWIELATTIGVSKPRPLNHYFNGGMVGVSAAHVSFLHLWKAFIELGRANGANLSRLSSGTRAMPFHMEDQDALNITAMYTEHPLSTMGPEAMGFIPAGFTMYHTVGPKPWKGSLLGRALKGIPPSDGTKFFFTQVSSPIRPYSPWQLRGKKIACAISGGIGRFYRRSR